MSRAREFYLQFTSSYCSSATQCDLLVSDQNRTKKAFNHIVWYKKCLVWITLLVKQAKFSNCGNLLIAQGTNHIKDKYGSQNPCDWTIRSQVVYLHPNIQCSSTTRRELVLADFVCQCLRYSLSPAKAVYSVGINSVNEVPNCIRGKMWRSPSTFSLYQSGI